MTRAVEFAVVGVVLVCLGTIACNEVMLSRQAQRGEQQQFLRRLDAISDVNSAGNISLLNNATRTKALAASASVQAFLTKARGGTEEFYKDLTNALQVYLCDSKCSSDNHGTGADSLATWSLLSDNDLLPYYRFVPASSAYALKDSNGNCVHVARPGDTATAQYHLGYCEVKANCFWTDIDPTAQTDRMPKYSPDQGVTLPSGTMTVQDSKDFLIKYAKTLGACVVPSIVLAALSLLTIIFFVMCRCCCNKCGGRSGRPEGYSCTLKALPVIFFFLFSIGIIVLAALSLMYYQIATDAVDEILTALVSLVQQAVDWIMSLVHPLEHISDTVVTSSQQVSTNLNNSGFIDEGLNGIITRLQVFETATAGVTLPRGCIVGTDLFCTPCDVCTNMNTMVTGATSQMQSAAGSGIQELQNVKTMINSKLVEMSSSISTFVGQSVNQTNVLVKGLNDTHDTTDPIISNWNSQSAARKLGILALFVLSIVTIAIGIVGIFFGVTPLRCLACILHIAYIIGFIALIITFLISAVFIAFSVLLGDVCQVSTVVSQDWTQVLGEEASVLNSCFRNESLITALNLSSSFEFSDSIHFPDLDLSSMLDFSAFDSFAGTINNTNTSTFNVNTSDMNSYLTVLNQMTSLQTGAGGCNLADGQYTLANIPTPWLDNGDPVDPNGGAHYMRTRYAAAATSCAAVQTSCSSHVQTCNFTEFVTEMYTNISTLQTISVQAVQFVTDMTTNMTNLVTYTNTFKGNVVQLNANLTTIKNSLMASLLTDVQTIKNEMYCTFVAVTYFDLYNSLCNEMTPAFLMISLCLFIMGFFLIPVNITLIISAKRLRSSGNGQAVSNETTLK